MTTQVYRSNKQQGAALLLVLWVVALLTAVAAGLLQIVQRSSLIASMTVQRQQTQALVDSALNRTIWLLAASDPSEHPLLDGQYRPIEIAGGHVQVAVSDESGLIDLNTASSEVIRSLLSITAKDPAQVRNLSARFDEIRQRTAIPFLDIRDLKSVGEMSEALYEQMEPAVTVYTRSPRPDWRYAPQLVRQAISEQPTGSAAEAAAGAGWVEEPHSLAGRVFRISITVIVRDHYDYKETAVVRLTGDRRQPYWLLEQRGPA